MKSKSITQDTHSLPSGADHRQQLITCEDAVDQFKYLSMSCADRIQYNAQLAALDDAMMRLFSPQQTESERRADLERKEDEFLERKAKEEQDAR